MPLPKITSITSVSQRQWIRLVRATCGVFTNWRDRFNSLSALRVAREVTRSTGAAVMTINNKKAENEANQYMMELQNCIDAKGVRFREGPGICAVLLRLIACSRVSQSWRRLGSLFLRERLPMWQRRRRSPRITFSSTI